MQRRTAIGWIGALTLPAGGNTFAQVTDLNDAINKAGRQRMLSQRVVKAYLAAGQGIAAQRAQEILKVFVPAWLLVAGVNMWVGVAHAGYSAREEFPILLLVFAVPAVAAVIAVWRLSQS